MLQVRGNEQLHGNTERLQAGLDVPRRLELRVKGAGVGNHRHVEGVLGVIHGVVNVQARFLFRRQFVRKILHVAVRRREAGPGTKNAPARGGVQP